MEGLVMSDGDIKSKLQTAMKVAMKSREREKVQTIRSVLSAIQYVEMNKDDLSDQDMIAILKSELKKRAEEMEFVVKANRTEQVVVLQSEMAVIESFLPKQLSAEEVRNYLQGKYSNKESLTIGALMKDLNDTFPGQVDGKLASLEIKNYLNS
jgi:uncharacterized protein YqeY